MRLAPLALVLAACASPPMGLGTGARLPAPMRNGDGFVSGGAGVAVGPGRWVQQVEASATARVRRWFSIDLGAAFTQQSQRIDGTDRELVATGGFPYLRPRFTMGHVTVATALAGFGFGGGGGGFFGGIADLQIGYGTETWSAYAGAYGHAFEVVSEASVEASSSQLRVGGEYSRRVGPARVGVALEVYRHHDTLRGGGQRAESRFVGAGLKLRITSPAFR